MSNLSDTILLICGHGRCGSSLVMQMLAAGGVKCAGKYPDFEPDEVIPARFSAVIFVRSERAAIAFWIASAMLGFARFSQPMSFAVLFAYPARMAAWVALRSIRYSSTKTACLGVKPFFAKCHLPSSTTGSRSLIEKQRRFPAVHKFAIDKRKRKFWLDGVLHS